MRPRRRRLRAIFALVLALLVGGESAGAARALGEGSTVHCCCGSHAIARACKCLHCPTRLRKEGGPLQARLATPSDCQPSVHDEALVVTATIAEPPRLPARDERAAPLPLAPSMLTSVALDPARPPP